MSFLIERSVAPAAKNRARYQTPQTNDCSRAQHVNNDWDMGGTCVKVFGRGHRVSPAGLPIKQILGDYSLY